MKSAIRNPQSAILLVLFGVLLHLSAREDYWLDEGYSLRRISAAWAQLYNPLAVRVAPPADPAAPPANPFDRRDVYDLNPPLYFALVRLLAGPTPTPLVARLFSSVPMVLALLFVTLHARRAHGATAGWVVLLLGATAPAVIYYGHEARPYALPLALACGLLWVMPRLCRLECRLEEPTYCAHFRLFSACALTAAAGALMHYAFAWWIVTLCGVFAARWASARRGGDAGGARAALAGAAGLAAGSIVALAACLPALAQLARCTTASTTMLSSEVMMNTFALPFSRIGSRPSSPALGFALQFALIAAAGWKLRGTARRAEGLTALALWLGPLALPVMMKLFFNLAYYERYAFFSLPGWFMTVAWVVECGTRNAECGMKESSNVKERVLGTGEAGLEKGGGGADEAVRAPRKIPHSAFRIPHLIVAAMLIFNLHWCGRNLGRPLRSVWRPAIRELLDRSRPGEAYTIDPDLMNSTFGVMARRPPAATWFSFSRGMPEGASALWILTETHINPQPKYEFDPAVWRTEKVVESPGVALFKATRQ